MTPKQVLSKLDKALSARRAKLLADARKFSRRKGFADDPDYYKRRALEKRTEASRLNLRTFSGLTYKMRSNYFENARQTCGFNPETMEGHSYRWYSLVKRIRGVVVLNTFHYSQQTAIHIGRVSKVLRDLGIKYKTLDAPCGLQDLASALTYELDCFARGIVSDRYARGSKMTAAQARARILKASSKQLTLLARFGHKATRKARLAALERAESDRLARNERNRERAAERRALARIVIVADASNAHAGATGLHVVKPHAWNWTEAGEYTGTVAEYERREALRKGYSTIFVHKHEPRHLSLVPGGES